MYQSPRTIDYVIAVLPTLIVIFDSIIMLTLASHAKGTPEQEYASPMISTILSIIIFIVSLVGIMYQHHEEFEIIPIFFKIIIRINVFQSVICAMFVMYLKNNIDQYSTYLTFLYITTIPIIFLAILPFRMGIRTVIHNREMRSLLENAADPRPSILENVP
jgi:FlaA1/EpsC-like NDP-sugar epimerase